jgi:hypothetical protein
MRNSLPGRCSRDALKGCRSAPDAHGEESVGQASSLSYFVCRALEELSHQPLPLTEAYHGAELAKGHEKQQR